MTVESQPKPARFRMYVDESGDHTRNLLEDSSRRYLALLGVWFRQADAYTRFADALETFKRDIFGPRPDKPVILHRSDIVNRKGAFGILRDEAVNERFNDGLLRLIQGAECHITCVIIDKKSHYERYADPFHPYHYCMAALLDRYSGWLNYKNAVGDVLAESRGGEEDLQLKAAYRRVFEAGTLMFDHQRHQKALTSKEIKIQGKHMNTAGLQLADMLAYPIKQACLLEKGLIADPGNVFGKRLVEAAADKLNCHASRKTVWGYGKVLL